MIASRPAADMPEGRAQLNEALRRAMPVTRLVDYGVPLGDALAVHARTADEVPECWDEVCEQLAASYAQLALEAVASGSSVTASESWRAASALYQAAQLAFNADSPRKLSLYDAGRSAMGALAALGEGIAPLALPSPAGMLYGWQIVAGAMRPTAAVIIIGGLSGWGSVYLDMAQALARRGLLCLLAEGPGQGSSRFESGIHLDASTLPLFSRFVDHAKSCGAARVGVWGNSFGGLFAAHLAAADPRVSAVCINGAPMEPSVPSFRTAREQMQAVMGIDDEVSLAEGLASLHMHPSRHCIGGAMLVVEGGRDPMVPLGQQRSFFDLLTTDRRTLMTWPDGEHTIYNHAAQRNARVADWFRAALPEKQAN